MKRVVSAASLMLGSARNLPPERSHNQGTSNQCPGNDGFDAPIGPFPVLGKRPDRPLALKRYGARFFDDGRMPTPCDIAGDRNRGIACLIQFISRRPGDPPVLTVAIVASGATAARWWSSCGYCSLREFCLQRLWPQARGSLTR
jgi:hypothetical protein